MVGLKVDQRGLAVWFAERQPVREAKWRKHEVLSRETYAAVDSRIKEWPPEKKKGTKEWKKGTGSAPKCMTNALTLGYCVQIKVRHPLCLLCVSLFSASHKRQYQIDLKISPYKICLAAEERRLFFSYSFRSSILYSHLFHPSLAVRSVGFFLSYILPSSYSNLFGNLKFRIYFSINNAHPIFACRKKDKQDYVQMSWIYCQFNIK